MKTYVAYAPNYDQGRLAVAYKLLLDAKNLKLKWEIASGADKLLMGDELKQKIEEIDIDGLLTTSILIERPTLGAEILVD